MNYQNWRGVEDARFGYGAMFYGFLEHAPDSVVFHEKASVDVHMGVPFSPGGWWKGQHRVLFTMWETDTLPPSFWRWLPQYDQVLVPCQHNVELFSRYHSNVTHVPLGVDTNFWKPLPKTSNQNVYRFHAGGSLWGRKGLDIVVKAFNSLKLPDAELHIKAAPHARDVPKTHLGPNIYLHRQWMDLETQRDWFLQADCFIAASRGEGFGLMPLQAIALGIPNIVSDSSGQQQFTHLATGVIPCRKTQAETIGLWDEPDQHVLAQLMLDHYHNRTAKQRQALDLATGVKQFTWEKATIALLNAIPTGQKLTTKTWITPEIVTNVILTRDLKCDIGKERFTFRKGVTYQVSENVHQVLFDAKVLA